MSSRVSLSLRLPDAPPLVALQTDDGAEMPKYCPLVKSPQGTYIAGFAHPHERIVLIVLSYIHGVSCLLLLLRDLKASGIVSAAFHSELGHSVAGLRSWIRGLLCGGCKIGSTASWRVR